MRQAYILFLVFVSHVTFGQESIDKEKLIESKRSLKEGNKLYSEGKFELAAASYEKSLKENTTYYKGAYNLGNSFFKQQKFKEAGDQFALANKLAKTKDEKAKTKELMGDSFIAQKDLENAEKSYKEALLKNPTDDVLRQKYIATKKAKEQQQQDDQNKDNQDQKDDQNKDDKGDNKDENQKDKNGDQDKKDDKGDDKKDQDGDQKEDDKGDKGDDKENQDQKDKGDDKEDQKNQNQQGNDKKDSKGEAQPQPSKLSVQQIEQLLESMGNEEEKTQKKVNAQKVKAKVRKNEKDW